MSPVSEKPPQPAPWTRGKDSWPMKSVEGVSGRATPKAKFVLAPKNCWKTMPVAGSVKGEVLCVAARERSVAKAAEEQYCLLESSMARYVGVVDVWRLVSLDSP